jgi:prophage DNA circulation protein
MSDNIIDLPATAKTVVDAQTEIEPVHQELAAEVAAAFRTVVRGLSKRPQRIKDHYKKLFGTRSEMLTLADHIERVQDSEEVASIWTKEVDQIVTKNRSRNVG